jgi:hypothetical protein
MLLEMLIVVNIFGKGNFVTFRKILDAGGFVDCGTKM